MNNPNNVHSLHPPESQPSRSDKKKIPAVKFLQSLSQELGVDYTLAAFDNSVVVWNDEDVPKFAEYLAQFHCVFEKDQSTPLSASVDKETQRAANQIATALVREQHEKRETKFWRGRVIADQLSKVLPDSNPLQTIGSHLDLFFDERKRNQVIAPKRLDQSQQLYSVLATAAEAMMVQRPHDDRCKIIWYFLSSPYDGSSSATMNDLHAWRKAGPIFSSLVFTRFTFACEDRLDPMPSEWTDIAWLFESANTPWQMLRVVQAIFELRDEFSGPDASAYQSINAFFRRVEAQQEKMGGVSFWDPDTATHYVYWVSWFMMDQDLVKIDFISKLCGIAQDTWEPEYPDFSDWQGLVEEALGRGYVELAQALTAYKLLDEVLRAKHVTVWSAVTALLNRLRAYPGFEMTARAASVAGQVLHALDAPALAKRLEAFAAPERLAPDKIIRFVVEGRKTAPKAKEIEARLVEQLGELVWTRLSSQSKQWLIEADMNWSSWRFSDDYDRFDWSAPALQFCKAIEKELVSRVGPYCVKAGDSKNIGAVTLGTVAAFLKKAADGESTRAQLLRNDSVAIPPTRLAQRLQKFVGRYRNAAAHPHGFDLRKLEQMRVELFSERLLKDLLERFV